jgi:signal transduction histidine kinase
MNNNKNSDKFKTETAAIKSFADCIDDSVIILDDKDAIIYLNQSARSLFMVSGNNFIEKPVEVLLPDYKDYFEKDYLDSDFNTDIILKINKHKKEFNIAINNIVNSKLKNSQGKIIVLRDITKNRLING